MMTTCAHCARLGALVLPIVEPRELAAPLVDHHLACLIRRKAQR